MKNIKYILKTISLLFITGLSTVNPITAQDTNLDQSEIYVSKGELITLSVWQNMDNLESINSEIKEQGLINLTYLSAKYTDKVQLDKIVTALDYQANTAQSVSFRYKAYLAKVAIENESYQDWVVANINSDPNAFFENLAEKVNNELLGDQLLLEAIIE